VAHGRSESEILQELAPDEAAFPPVMKAWFTHSALYDISARWRPRTARWC